MATTPDIISSTTDLIPFLSSISPSSTLYLDLEGENLGREGTLTIITVLVYPQQKSSLIDVQTLGNATFTTPDATGKTLKSVLEDTNIQKCLWDVRSDADALWHHHRVRLTGVVDIQLFENASRLGKKTFVRGLEKCVEADLGLGPQERLQWVETKNEIKALMSHDIFSRRPIDAKTARYCVNDVVHLPALRSIYEKRLSPQWLQKAMDESRKRVYAACGLVYQPKSKERAYGPWATKANKRHKRAASFQDEVEDYGWADQDRGDLDLDIDYFDDYY